MTRVNQLIPVVAADDFSIAQVDRAIDAQTYQAAQEIVDDVRSNGVEAIRKYALKFGERIADQPLVVERAELEKAAQRLPNAELELLERVASRIDRFAQAQLGCLTSLEIPVPGGFAGHTLEAIARVGCYAPAGRFPLPSTVLMTAVTAKAAGCSEVVVATPNPGDLMLASAYVAGADVVLAVGGAHAIAAMAHGCENLQRCDLICGPGNRWVTAAKKIVFGSCGIDMLAGPSELVVIADDASCPELVAADLLAQAEHDIDARPMVIAQSQDWIAKLLESLAVQLDELETAEIARESLAKSVVLQADSIEQSVRIANELAPEHLELHCEQSELVAKEIRNAGCIFLGHATAEVFGDYGIGPNHTLPTAGAARWSGGLNVFDFVRVRTWIRLDESSEEIIQDTAALANLEGLHGHRSAALKREGMGT